MKTISKMSELQAICEQAKSEFLASLAHQTMVGVQPAKPDYSKPYQDEESEPTVQQWIETLERDGCERGRVKVKFDVNRRYVRIIGLVVEFRAGPLIVDNEYYIKNLEDTCWIDKGLQEDFFYPNSSVLV